MKKSVLWLMLTLFVMIGLPWLFIALLGSEGSLPACLAMFFVGNPVYSLIVGRSAGKNVKKHWFLPAVPPLLFILGIWIVLRGDDSTVYIYAAIYLLLGILAMLFRRKMLLRRKEKNPEE